MASSTMFCLLRCAAVRQAFGAVPEHHGLRDFIHVMKRVLIAVAFVVLLEGTTFGFPSLQPLFLAAHVFEEACDTTVANATASSTSVAQLMTLDGDVFATNPYAAKCDAQSAMLGALLITGAASGDVLGLIVGILVTVVRKRTALTAAAATLALGFAVIAVVAQAAQHLPLWLQATGLHTAFVVVAAGQGLLFSTCISYASDIMAISKVNPELGALHPYVTGLVAGAYSLASLTPLAFGSIAQAVGGPVASVYVVFTVIAAALAIFARYADSPQLVQHEEIPVLSFTTRLMATLSTWRYVLQRSIYLVWPWAIVSVVFMDWYQSTVTDQISYNANDTSAPAASSLTTSFYVILPVAGVLGNVVFTLLLPPSATSESMQTAEDENSSASLLVAMPPMNALHPTVNKTAWRGLLLCLACTIVFGISMSIRNAWLQLLTFICFSMWRSGVFVTYYHHVLENFPPEAVLLLINGESFVAGLLAFINDSLRTVITDHGSGAFVYMNGAFAIGIVVTNVAALVLTAVWMCRGRRTQ